ncbi:MAG: twin-arginine translocase subunit TatC [Succinivibrio sp.]
MQNTKDEKLKTMSITAHLLEFRKRLMLILLGIVCTIIVLFPFMQQIFDLAAKPLMQALPQGTQLLAVSVVAPVMGPLKVLLFSAFFISLPFTAYQIWMFAAPALYRHEKKLIIPIVISAFLMFGAGIAYCYFVVFGMVFQFIAGFSPQSIAFAPDISSYIGFVLHMFVAFGLTFEVPVAVIVLCSTGAVTPASLSKFRRYLIVAAFAVSAVITPPDVCSQLLLALPIVILYELGLLLAKLCFRNRALQQKSA